MEDVRAVDEKVFFKSHCSSLPRARKLDKPSLRPFDKPLDNARDPELPNGLVETAQGYGLAG